MQAHGAARDAQTREVNVSRRSLMPRHIVIPQQNAEIVPPTTKVRIDRFTGAWWTRIGGVCTTQTTVATSMGDEIQIESAINCKIT